MAALTILGIDLTNWLFEVVLYASMMKYNHLTYLISILPDIHVLHRLGGQEDLNAEHWLRLRYEFETLTQDNKGKYHDQLPREIKRYLVNSG